MVTIICTIYEKCDFIEFLEYTKRKKIEEYENQKITRAFLDYELERIRKLLERVDGKYVTDYGMVSSKYRKKHPLLYVPVDDSVSGGSDIRS